MPGDPGLAMAIAKCQHNLSRAWRRRDKLLAKKRDLESQRGRLETVYRGIPLAWRIAPIVEWRRDKVVGRQIDNKKEVSFLERKMLILRDLEELEAHGVIFTDELEEEMGL